MISLVAILVIYPIFWVFIGTVLDNGKLNFKYWSETFSNSFVWEALLNTLIASLSAAFLATIIGLILAFIITRTNTPFRSKLEMISIIPFITVPFLIAMAWDILGNKEIGLINTISRFLGLGTIINIESMPGLIWLLALYTTPLVFLIISSVLKRQDPFLEESSIICGSKKPQTFFNISLPLIKPGIVSAFFLAFVVSAGTFGIHSVIGTPAKIPLLTTEIVRSTRLIPVNMGMAAVLSSMLLIIGFIGIYFQTKSLGKKEYNVIGKQLKPKLINLGNFRYLAFGFCLIYVTLAVLLPYFVLLIRSFKPYAFSAGSTLQDALRGWSIKNYVTILDYDASIRAFMNSIFLSISAAIIVLLITIVVSYIITKSNLRGKNLLYLISTSPIAIPGIVLGVGLLWAFSRQPFMLYGTMAILLISYIVKGLPYALQSLNPSFLQLHKEMEESSRLCGASWSKQFKLITIPLIKPGILVAFMLAFLVAFKDVGASVLLSSYGKEVVGVLLFSQWEQGLIAQASATAMITLMVTFVILFLIQKTIKAGIRSEVE